MKSETLLHTIYQNRPELLAEIETFIARGDDLNAMTEYDESPLRVASNNGRFEVVLRLLAAGADANQLKWTDTILELVRGTTASLVQRLADTACSEIEMPDYWQRTPLLIAIKLGDRDKLAVLLSHGANRSALGRCNKTPMMYAVERDDPALLEFLLKEGFELDACDEFGITALEKAVEEGGAASVRWLLGHGAKLRGKNEYGFSLIYEADTAEVAKVLLEYGEDINNINARMHAEMLGLHHKEAPEVRHDDYLAARYREFGDTNAEETNKPFWLAMIRCGGDAWHARKRFDDPPAEPWQAVWSYERYGRSTTLMPDGRIIEIGGEHEDFYDPDFCIYNDVTVFDAAGGIRIFSYPEQLFPPTDSHSATLVGDTIYIIGCLGYMQARQPGFTPVYRLDTNNYQIERVETSGEMPGWISRHKVSLTPEGQIRITGGQLIVMNGSEQDLIDNDGTYQLCLEQMLWKKIA